VTSGITKWQVTRAGCVPGNQLSVISYWLLFTGHPPTPRLRRASWLLLTGHWSFSLISSPCPP